MGFLCNADEMIWVERPERGSHPLSYPDPSRPSVRSVFSFLLPLGSIREKTRFCFARRLLVMPTAAFAQSTGRSIRRRKGDRRHRHAFARMSTASASRHDQGEGGADPGVHPEQTPGQTILDTINLIPGVNFTEQRPLRLVGRQPPHPRLRQQPHLPDFDGIPLNDTGNYAIFSNQQLDPEMIEQVNVSLGSTDVDSPTASAAGGTVNYPHAVSPSRRSASAGGPSRSATAISAASSA